MVLYTGARFYARSEVAGLLRQVRDPNRPLPDVTFDKNLTVNSRRDRGHSPQHGADSAVLLKFCDIAAM
jgi:hypothetical protein